MVLHLNKLESGTKGCTVAGLVEIGPVVLEIFLISLICNYLPMGKGGALHLNKFESPSSKNALCQVWLKLVQCFLRRFLNLHLAYECEY